MRVLLILSALVVGCGGYPEPALGVACRAGPFTSTEPDFDSCLKFTRTVKAAVLAYRYAFQTTANTDVVYAVELHPDSDGRQWPPNAHQADAGYTGIYAETHCPRPHASHPIRPRVVLASMDWDSHQARSVLCHEYGHVVRGCAFGDHGAFDIANYDQICAIAEFDPALTIAASEGEIRPPPLP